MGKTAADKSVYFKTELIKLRPTYSTVRHDPIPTLSDLPLEPATHPPKQPRTVFSNSDGARPHRVYAFSPNRHTLGGTAYLIVDEVNILVDCPIWDETTAAFLQQQGGVQWLFLTHRGGISNVAMIQQALGCQVVIQEQEAYLLPELKPTRFTQSFHLGDRGEAIWTPGHSPGSACLYYNRFGGILFSGRHLLPSPQGELQPLQTAKTFHWRRQKQSVAALRNRFSPETLEWICPGANTGFLRGSYAIGHAYEKLVGMTEQLDPNSF